MAVMISELLAPKDAKLITRKSKSHQPGRRNVSEYKGVLVLGAYT